MSKRKIVTQVLLSRDNEYMICWLPADPRIQKGAQLTLKGVGGGPWIVDAVYVTKLKDEILVDWEVGGLG